jgi:hypothetical protein
MFSSFRNRFGIPGVISVIALVFAMFGGAYAASNDGGPGSKATASAKKGPRGPRGPKGPAGPAGSQGPAGPAGPAGATGDKGDTGSAGSNGAPGKSVVVAGTAPGCAEGGISVEVEGSGSEKEVCNGEPGEEGSPWVNGGTLPVSSTETGTWAAFVCEDTVFVPIPFTIPLAAVLDGAHVHYVLPGGNENILGGSGFEEVPSTVCLGSAAEPKAASGHLCVYEAFRSNLMKPANVFIKAPVGNESWASKAGAYFETFKEGDPAKAAGSWAVTG